MNQKLKEKKNNRFRKIGGITLISLVITIIVLIILAGVVIYLNLENNGIFTRAKQAKETTNKQTATEIINLKITTAQMNNYTKEQRMPTLKELSLALGEDNEIKYVSQTSRVASTEYDVPSENPETIYTMLKKYPYEFEINGELQLASIDGVKIGNNTNTKTHINFYAPESRDSYEIPEGVKQAYVIFATAYNGAAYNPSVSGSIIEELELISNSIDSSYEGGYVLWSAQSVYKVNLTGEGGILNFYATGATGSRRSWTVTIAY